LGIGRPPGASQIGPKETPGVKQEDLVQIPPHPRMPSGANGNGFAGTADEQGGGLRPAPAPAVRVCQRVRLGSSQAP
jgi:hypothetical protein